MHILTQKKERCISQGTEAKKTTAAIGNKFRPDAICWQGKLFHPNSPFEAQASRGVDVGPLLEMRLRSQQVFAQRRRQMEDQSPWMGKSQYSTILQHPNCDTSKETSKDKIVSKPRKKSRMNQFGDSGAGRSLGCKRRERQEEQDRAKQTRSGCVRF